MYILLYVIHHIKYETILLLETVYDNTFFK